MDIAIKLNDDWIAEEHLRNMQEGDWHPVSDGKGGVLTGVTGRRGVTGPSRDGVIGGDIISMSAGAAFPLHEHEGAHVLYVLSGEGFVHINGVDHPIRRGYMVYIHAHYPHGVGVGKAASEPLVFLAVGHPHAEVDSPHRMQLVRETDHHSD